MPNIRQMIHLWSSRKIKPEEMGIETLTSRIASGEAVSFSRFGDGEWSAVVGRDGANCDGHIYSRGLQAGLKNVLLSNPTYDLGMQYFALKNMGREIVRFISEEKISRHWWNADLFHDANLRGELFPFVDLLRKSRTVVIGPAYLRELTLFSPTAFVEIPQKNCFDEYDRILAETTAISESEPAGMIFLFSASMASNVLIHELYAKFGTKHSYLDVGALWDIYVGRKTRGVYSEPHWDETIKRNSGESPNRSLLFYNLFPKTTWKEITAKILQNVPHDDIIVHITLPKSRFWMLPQVKSWLSRRYPKIVQILWSYNTRGTGETRGFNLFRTSTDLSRWSVLTYAHSKGSSRKRKNTPPVQDWTELMRYFSVERLDLTKKAFSEGAWFTGVNFSTSLKLDEQSRRIYEKTKFIFEGNFVSVNLDAVRDRIRKTEPVLDYYGVERYWGMLGEADRCVSFHQSAVDHYGCRYDPSNYRNESL